MTKPIQENLDEQFTRKISQTKNVMLNTRKNYVTHDHNYYRKNKKKCQRSNKKKKLNHSEKLINDNDEYGNIPDWCAVDISSDEENDIEGNGLLSEALKIELEKDLLREYKNKNCKYYWSKAYND